MEHKASVWVHCGSHWLFVDWLLVWLDIAMDNFDLECDVGILRNLLVSDWRYSCKASPNLVGWALQSSFGSFCELWKSIIPTLEDFIGSYRESFPMSISLYLGGSNDVSIRGSSSPSDGSPISYSALVASSCGLDVNSDLRELKRRVVVLPAFAVLTHGIREVISILSGLFAD